MTNKVTAVLSFLMVSALFSELTQEEGGPYSATFFLDCVDEELAPLENIKKTFSFVSRKDNQLYATYGTDEDLQLVSLAYDGVSYINDEKIIFFDSPESVAINKAVSECAGEHLLQWNPTVINPP